MQLSVPRLHLPPLELRHLAVSVADPWWDIDKLVGIVVKDHLELVKGSMTPHCGSWRILASRSQTVTKMAVCRYVGRPAVQARKQRFDLFYARLP